MKIKEITHLLEDVEEGTAFVVLKGKIFNNLKDVPEALRKGTELLITERSLSYPVAQVVGNDPRLSALHLAERVYPMWRNLKLVGITGTNGKTTTSFLTHGALERLGEPTVLVGTVVWYDLYRRAPAKLTTPEAFYLRRILGRGARKGARFGVMEVSSIGLVQGRVRGVEFEVGVLTNIGWDHIDYHGSYEEYVKAKILLFRQSRKALLNADDPLWKTFKRASVGHIFTYGRNGKDFPYRVLEKTSRGMILEVAGHRISTPLLGEFNAQNLVAAFGSLVLLGFNPESAAWALSDLKGPPGRLERVFDGDFSVFVDYAHTPDAIDRVLGVLRPHFKRLLVVFGAGGNRDRSKRPKMAKTVERWADLVVLTSDNPRWEDPKAIVRDIAVGFKRIQPVEILDRREAIEFAIKSARRRDAIVILGKGHENYQEIEGKRIPFSDAEVVREILS
ncbi:MAG: UDP-N-acetylmuramoyl-L-alanyl-D-glutamate--2,6-diaminopimelate ligase [Thermotogae bacterium]|nr:UDP-N-acetylmuramoyl-L-alanyl-D-glutamate--2,6-diaminopimelate ligase [Thermotogota bacterium]